MANFTVYPNGIDGSSQLPLTKDNVTPVKAEVANRLRSAIIAVESELGIQPSSTFATVRARLDSIDQLIAKLNSLIAKHAFTHITGAQDEIDGDELDIDWNPSNYVPDSSPAEASGVDSLAAHLKGIDNKLAQGSDWTITSVKVANYNTSIGELVRFNPSGGSFNIVLPQVTSANAGQAVLLKNIENDTTPIMVGTTGADTIDDATNDTLNQAYQARMYISDGVSEWMRH